MKKMLFLMLFLLILGAVNVSAQVRIGGNGVPNGAAVLDLNATDANNNGTKGLALPRVSLANNTAVITTGTPNLNGMLVYNTSGSLSAGIYYWDTNKWVKVSDGSFVEKDSIIGNEVVDATPGRGLQRTGSGSTASPYTLGVAPQGIDTSMLATYSDQFIYMNNGFGDFRALRLRDTGPAEAVALQPFATARYTVDRSGCYGPNIIHLYSTDPSQGVCVGGHSYSDAEVIYTNVGPVGCVCHIHVSCFK